MTDLHRSAAPSSATVSTIEVRTEKLDDFIQPIGGAPYFLKIDVQGAEKLVLDGAARALRSSIVGVQLEMSVVSLYKDQPHACELDSLLRSFGFECWDVIPIFRNPDTLRLLQYDGIYFKS
jgi:hypothetical protein